MIQPEWTIAKSGESLLEERKSRFLGFASPAISSEEAENVIKTVAGRFSDATHIVWALRLGENGSYERYTDAGEPSGTAGAPILKIIQAMKLTDIVVTVARYFGGIKLGTGGLVRAYSSCAKMAIENAGIVKYIRLATVISEIPYAVVSQWLAFLEKFGASVILQDFEEKAKIVVKIEHSKLETARSFLGDITKGNFTLEVKGNK